MNTPKNLLIENPGRTCPGFIANIFLRKFFVTGWLKKPF